MLENVIIRAAVLFSEILLNWLNMNNFFHYLTKPIIAEILCLLSVAKCYYVYISQGDFEREELERNQLKFLLRELRIPGEVHVSNFFIHLVT